MSQTLLDAAKEMIGEDVEMNDFAFVTTCSEKVKILVQRLENHTTDVIIESLETCLNALQLAAYLNFQNSYQLLEKELLNQMSKNTIVLIQNRLPKPMFEQLLIKKDDLELILISGHKQLISKIGIWTADYYAKDGKLLSLQYCLENQDDISSSNIMNSACKNGHLPIIQFLYSLDKNCMIDVMDWASENGYLSIVQFLYSIGANCMQCAMSRASLNGHLLVVQFLHHIGKDCTTYAMDSASEYGHLSVIQFLHSIGKRSMSAMDRASKNGHLLIIQFLHGVGKYCTTYTMDSASANGHLSLVQFLHSIGKECTKDAMDWASRNNHLLVVQFLHNLGKNCSSYAIDWAIERDHSSIIQFLYSSGKN